MAGVVVVFEQGMQKQGWIGKLVGWGGRRLEVEDVDRRNDV